MPQHNPPLVPDTDFLVLEEAATVTVANPDGSHSERPTTAVSKVYLAETNTEVFLCTKCNGFTSDSSASVVAHGAGAHGRPKTDPEVIRKAAAFDLLPKGMQENLLGRLENGDKPVQKERAKRGTAVTKFGRQPLLSHLNYSNKWREVAEAAGISEGHLRNLARGAGGTGLTNAQAISVAVGKPLTELFTRKMLQSIANRK